MIFTYICTILLLMINTTSFAQYGCPSFHYSPNNGYFQAIMEVPTPSNHNNMITFYVQLSVGDTVNTEELKKKLLFLGSSDDILHKRKLVYKLSLPPSWNNYEKKITKIAVNDENFCWSDHFDTKNFEMVTTINLSMSLTVTTHTIRVPSGSTQKPSYIIPSQSTQESNIFNYFTTPARAPETPAPTPAPKPAPAPAPTRIITPTYNQPFQNKYCYRSSKSNLLIANGEQVKNNMYPWIGAMVIKKQLAVEFQCGATLITEKLALTAGHCVTPNSNEELLLIFGTNDYSDLYNDEMQFARITGTKVHPDYSKNSADADIAIVELSKKLDFTNAVRPICLCSFKNCFEEIVQQNGVVAGWGKTETNQNSNQLKQIFAGIVSEEDCLRSSYLFNTITSNRTFCAGAKNGQGPCNGDSGSGFYLFVEGTWVIRGIVSRSLRSTDGRCDLNQYIVYVDVTSYLDWIQRCIETNNLKC